MIAIRFEEREKIGLQYALESLHGCSPFGIEKIRRLRFYSPEERDALETELYNVEQAAKAAEELKGVTTGDIAARVYAMMAEDLGPDLVLQENTDTP